VLVAACGGGQPPSPSSGTGATPAGSPAPAASHPLVGTYNLQAVDAINLVIEPDGTFRWHIHGCDFFGGDCGTWSASAGGLVLEPRAGAKLQWVDDVGVSAVQGTLVLQPGPGRGTIVTGTVAGNSLRQTWNPGRVCATCREGSPVALHPCDEPVPRCR
jgi:hypothetical protein